MKKFIVGLALLIGSVAGLTGVSLVLAADDVSTQCTATAYVNSVISTTTDQKGELIVTINGGGDQWFMHHDKETSIITYSLQL